MCFNGEEFERPIKTKNCNLILIKVLALKVIGNVMLDFTEWKKAPVLQRKNRKYKFLKTVYLHLQ